MIDPAQNLSQSARGRSAAETILQTPDDDSALRLARDVALASELLKCGPLSELQVSETLADWSLYGSVSLRQHLEHTGLLSADELKELDQRVAKALADTPVPEQFAPHENPVTSTVARFDETGRVAKLFGIGSTTIGDQAGSGRAGMARYRLIRLLGQGGLGRVWLARDLDLQRLVALKEISAARENPVSVQRFRNEAEITGRLEHPAIVPIYQLATDADNGRSYYTMRFLGRGTLQDSIAEYHERRTGGDEDPLLLRRLLAAFVSVCQALGHAHARKVIHRDLKPENVVIDNFGQVIVIDWGLAKVLDEADAEHLTTSALSGDVDRTTEGQVLGTPLFMAPEQAAGRLDEVDTRTDIYGLGAILFAICTGRPPHEATHARSTAGKSRGQAAARELFTAIATGPTPQATEINADLDPALASICAKAMARRRYARYQEASDLAADVERWMAGEPVSAYNEPFIRRARRWVRHHQRLSQGIAAGLAILLATALTLGMLGNQRRLAEQQSRFHELHTAARELEIRIADAARDLATQARFISDMPTHQGYIRAAAGDEGDAKEIWLGRLEAVYRGLLRANADYLAVTFIAIKTADAMDAAAAKEPSASSGDDKQPASAVPSVELLRVERNAGDRTFIRTAPLGKLVTLDADPLLQQTLPLAIDDVLFSMNLRGERGLRDRTRRLIVATPIYDEKTGTQFGMMTIEADLNAKLLAALTGVTEFGGEAFIADGEGTLWAQASPDAPPTAAGADVHLEALCPEAKDLLAAKSTPFEVDDGVTYYGKLFRDQPDSKGVIVFLRLPKEE